MTFRPRIGTHAVRIVRNRLPGAEVICEFKRPETTVKKKNVTTVLAGGPKHIAPMETEVMRPIMGIVEHMAIRQYDDGDARDPGTILIKTVGAAWQVTAKDPDSCSQLVVTANTLDDALVLLDTLLRAEEAPWEVDPWAKARKAQAKKK